MKLPVTAVALVVLANALSMPTLGSSTKPALEPDDPAPPEDLPAFWKSRLEDIEDEVHGVVRGEVKTVALSPGRRPVHAVSYGERDELRSQADYNSAVAARNPAYYARKDSSTKPVALFLGPVHGQEIENIVGLVNLIHVAETGKDHRGKAWPALRGRFDQLRVIVIPCANPDGRARCPYDAFRGIPTKTMTKYGQGTRKDGSFWGWPGAKAVHPMTGNVTILGAYFNDDGINPMHDDFFSPMAKETEAVLRIAREEAPDIVVSLHSHENSPVVLQSSYVPIFLKRRIEELSSRVQERYRREGLPYGSVEKPGVEDENPPPRSSFNLTSALHHVSGAMAFTFECCHGSVSERRPEPLATYEQILDIQLCLYDEMLRYVLENRLLWTVAEGDPNALGER